MDMENVLRATIPLLNSMHVLGSETAIMEAVKNNIRTVISAIEQAKKEEASHADRNEQRKDV